MGHSDMSVRELVSRIERREIQLPEMQRRYVWTKTQVRDLLDSLYRKYPSGLILAWQSPGGVETREFAVDGAGIGHSPLLLLDGQQRLTSLSAILNGKPISVKGRKTPIEILFNLEHPDELTFITEAQDTEGTTDDTEYDPNSSYDDADEDALLERMNQRAFVVASKRLAALPNWVEVSDVFTKDDRDLLKDAGVESWDDPRYEKYISRIKALRAIEEYIYRVDILEPTKSYEEVTEIFVRVNSLGAKLRSSDLALAQITAKWHGSLTLFEIYREILVKRGFDLDLGTILRTLIALITNQSRFMTVGTISRERLEKGWERTKRALDFAVNFAKSNCGIPGVNLLSSPYQLILAAYYFDRRGYEVSLAESSEFRRWFLIANAKGRYSRGSSESFLDQDLATIRDGGGPDELLKRLEQQVGRLQFTEADLYGRNSRSGAFKTLFLLLQQAGARHWATQLKISAAHDGKPDKIQFHHISPTAFMKKARPDLEAREINDIANLAFIGAKTNQRIKDRAPSVYKLDFESQDLGMQYVDFSDSSDEPANYENFVSKRRRAIADALNEFLST